MAKEQDPKKKVKINYFTEDALISAHFTDKKVIEMLVLKYIENLYKIIALDFSSFFYNFLPLVEKVCAFLLQLLREYSSIYRYMTQTSIKADSSLK